MSAPTHGGSGAAAEVRPSFSTGPSTSSLRAMPPGPRADRTILVVEDDPCLREVITEVLTGRGYIIIEARDAWEAIDILQRQQVDLVISDLTMPGGGGRHVLAVAREMPGGPGVLLLTGCTDERSQDELLAAGAHGVLGKPMQLTELLRQVAKFAQ